MCSPASSVLKVEMYDLKSKCTNKRRTIEKTNKKTELNKLKSWLCNVEKSVSHLTSHFKQAKHPQHARMCKETAEDMNADDRGEISYR